MKRLVPVIGLIFAASSGQSANAQQIISNGPVIVLKSKREQEAERARAEEEARRAEREETQRMVQAQTRTSAAGGTSQYDNLSQGDALAGTAATSCAQGNGVVIRTSGDLRPSSSSDCKK